MGAHPVKPGMIGIDVRNGGRRTGFCTFGVAAAQITFIHNPGVLVVVDCPERTGNGAHLATDADVSQHVLGSGFLVQHDGFDGTGVHAPGLAALGAGIGDKPALLMEGKYLDAGFGGIEYPFRLIGTGQFALETTGTLFRLNLKCSQHHVLLR